MWHCSMTNLYKLDGPSVVSVNKELYDIDNVPIKIGLMSTKSKLSKH